MRSILFTYRDPARQIIFLADETIKDENGFAFNAPLTSLHTTEATLRIPGNDHPV